MIAAAERAVRLAASTGAVEMEAEAYNLWGLGLHRQGEYLAAKDHLEHALALARAVGLRHAEASILRDLGTLVREAGLEPHILRELGNAEKLELVRAYYQESLRLHRALGDRLGEARTLNALGLHAYHSGDYAGARATYEDALRLSHEMGYRHGENAAVGNLGLVAAALGYYGQARALYGELLRLARQIGDRWGEGVTLAYLALAEFYDQVDRRTVHERASAAVRVAVELDNPPLEALAQLTLGHTLGSLGQWREAAAVYDRALMLRRGMGAHAEAIEALAWLAHVALAEGDVPAAKGHVEEIVTFLQTHTLDGEIAATQIYLTCYQALRAASDPRAPEILRAGYDFLQARAALIPDEADRRSFLENVPHNRALVDVRGSG